MQKGKTATSPPAMVIPRGPSQQYPCHFIRTVNVMFVNTNPDLISVPRSVSLCYVVSNFPNQVFVVILHSLITEMPEARLRHSKVGLDSLKFPSVICRSLKGIIRTGWNCWRLYERGRISVNFNAIDIFIHFFRNWGFQSKTTTDFPGK